MHGSGCLEPHFAKFDDLSGCVSQRLVIVLDVLLAHLRQLLRMLHAQHQRILAETECPEETLE